MTPAGISDPRINRDRSRTCQVRGKGQLELAGDARTTPRYVSFVETGRAQASRQMVVRLAGALDVPLRERNALLLAAGYAPLYSSGALDAPELDRDPIGVAPTPFTARVSLAIA